MITRIEIDGFKSFKEFALDLAPFQVIIGPNGSGKSNLLEAIHLLSLLAVVDLREAFQRLRGEPHDLFTIQPDDESAMRIRFAVEMLVNASVEDNWGGKAELTHRRLRYELEIRLSPLINQPVLYIADESLHSIPAAKDRWLSNLFQYGVQPNTVSSKEMRTYMDARDGEPPNNNQTVYKDPASSSDREIRVYLAASKQTSVGRIDNCDFPHVLAARHEMMNWNLFPMIPDQLRRATTFFETVPGWAGSILPGVLYRLKHSYPLVLNTISRELTSLVSDISKVEVEKNEARNQYEVFVRLCDGRRMPASVLSDGIIRLLGIVTITNDPSYSGILMFEEPENSIHSAQLKRLVIMLRDSATDPRQFIMAPRIWTIESAKIS